MTYEWYLEFSDKLKANKIVNKTVEIVGPE